MFYVNPMDNRKSNKIMGRQTQRKRSTSNEIQSTSVFQSTLQNTIVEQTNKDIESLLQDIYDAGQKLYDDATISNLRGYRNTLKKFLQMASKSMFEISILRGRKIDLKIIRIIDEKLKFITDNFFELQKDKMQLLSEIEEIKGLVVDVVY